MCRKLQSLFKLKYLEKPRDSICQLWGSCFTEGIYLVNSDFATEVIETVITRHGLSGECKEIGVLPLILVLSGMLH